MAKNPLNKKLAREIQQEAEKIARSLQKPGQTKEQTQLIAQGIRQGIETYRRQQAEKARDFDKELKRRKKEEPAEDNPAPLVEERIVYRRQWLPWGLFIASLGVIIFLYAQQV